MAASSSDSLSRKKPITPGEAMKAGGHRIWTNAITAVARSKGCSNAIPKNFGFIMSANSAVPLSSVKQGGGSGDGESFDDTPIAQRKGKAPAAIVHQQQDLGVLLYQWTDPRNDWNLFSDIDIDDPEIGSKMFMSVLHKYMGMGSHPIGEYLDEMREKQRDDETSVECYERIKRAAHALECVGRPQPLVGIFDSLVRALPSEHMHWLNAIDGSTIDRDTLDAVVWQKGSFIDRSRSVVDKSEKSAFAAKVDTTATQKQFDALSSKFDVVMAALAAQGGRGGRGGGCGGRGGRGGRGGGRSTCNHRVRNRTWGLLLRMSRTYNVPLDYLSPDKPPQVL